MKCDPSNECNLFMPWGANDGKIFLRPTLEGSSCSEFQACVEIVKIKLF
jgi:hypothetical protein